jgi:hypothetical protein
LVVDNFAVKYTRREDAEHLMAVLKKDYTATEDWTGTKYLGLTVEWTTKRDTCIYGCQDMSERH